MRAVKSLPASDCSPSQPMPWRQHPSWLHTSRSPPLPGHSIPYDPLEAKVNMSREASGWVPEINYCTIVLINCGKGGMQAWDLAPACAATAAGRRLRLP